MQVTRKVQRPILRYHGGKWLLAPWIISHFPSHKFYTEVYAGAASVLLRKPKCKGEIINDRYDLLTNLFKVLREPNLAAELKRKIELTPYSRAEYLKVTPENLALIDCPIEKARLIIFKSFAGFGSASANIGYNTSFRANNLKGGSIPAHQWANYAQYIDQFVERLRGVTIENRDAIEVLKQHDSKETLHYVDPPYVWSTRSQGKKSYVYEMTDDQHKKLALQLHKLQGMVVLSGYDCSLYNELYPTWVKVHKEHRADGARLRTETLWLNPATIQANNNLFNHLISKND